MSKKRGYTLRKRAETQDETRRRIVEAAVQLHEEIGPRATSISAIAERAGVQRLTVYRHFPDEAAVFRACTAHWLALHPPPDPGGWAQIEDGLARARAALAALYAYYAGTAPMWTRAYRDEPDVPALHQPMAEIRGVLREIAGDLLAHFRSGQRRKLLAATLQHAVAFSTWQSLDAQGLSQPQKIETVLRWLAAFEDA